MDTPKLVFLAGLLLASLATGVAQDPVPEEALGRRQAIVDELQQRRDARSFYGYLKATVDNPTEEFRMPPDDMPGFPVGLAVQFYANLAQKEVMVSARVGSKMLSISRTNPNEKDLVKALRAAGIRITDVGRSTVAFTDEGD